MKKLIFSVLFIAITSLSLFSCTEENVKPQGGGGPAGGDQCQYGCV